MVTRRRQRVDREHPITRSQQRLHAAAAVRHDPDDHLIRSGVGGQLLGEQRRQLADSRNPLREPAAAGLRPVSSWISTS